MVTHEITFRILLTQGKIRLALFLLLLAALPRMAATAEVATLNTYFPPPAATHDALTIYGDVKLARDREKVYIGSESNENTYVAVGQDQEPIISGLPNVSPTLVINGTLRVDGCIWLGGNPPNPPGTFRCSFEQL